MPTYQYACTACGHQLEAVQSFSDEPLTECPECAGKLRKVFSAVGIVFKGSGFYRTDSRSGSSSSTSSSSATGSSASASNGGESGTAASAESKSSESKPAQSSGTSDKASASATASAAS